jgi:lipoprotein NlpD
LLLCACADTASGGPESYVVRPQDTLYSIAWRHDLDYRDLARWNNIGSDFRISVGQVLVLGPRQGSSVRAAPVAARPPGTAASAAASPAPGTPAAGTPAPGRPAPGTPQVGKPRPLPEPKVAQSSAPPPGGDSGLRWVWPTDRTGAPRPVPGGGILLSGRLGQDVRAASAGRVVYTGNGLRGYGNLIIIKHADTVLSAYAHNREMLVHDGQDVGMGQVIGHMGEGPNQAPILYFEIRQNGKPVDPLPYLQKAK